MIRDLFLLIASHLIFILVCRKEPPKKNAKYFFCFINFRPVNDHHCKSENKNQYLPTMILVNSCLKGPPNKLNPLQSSRDWLGQNREILMTYFVHYELRPLVNESTTYFVSRGRWKIKISHPKNDRSKGTNQRRISYHEPRPLENIITEIKITENPNIILQS